MSSNFYRAFEDRHRGSRELIIERLKVYLPFIEQLKESHGACLALDVGCGRGEWLQLLQENGVQAFGVDMDAGMLQACHELGLEVEQKDAIEALKAQPDQSLSIVSGFHIVEHIDFALVQELVHEAFRVLRPGGLLILETPNAENLVVGTHNFYLDATHQRPLPAPLLVFVTEFFGFSRNKVLRLQEDPALHNLEHPSLLQVLQGVSPDYAVIAQKPADPEMMASFDSIFSKDYGISLSEIAERYERAVNADIKSLKKNMANIAQKEEQLYSVVEKIQERNAQAEHHLMSGLHKAELRTVQLETLLEQLRLQLDQTTQKSLQEEVRARQADLELREAKTNIAQWQARYDVLQAGQQHTLNQNQQLMDQLLESLKRLQAVETQLKQSQDELLQASQTIHDLQKHRDQFEEGQVHELRELNKALEQQLLDAQNEIYSAQSINKQNVSDLQACRQELLDTQNELNEVKRAHDQNASDLQACRQQLLGTQNELNEVQHTNHHNWNELQVCKQKLIDIQSELHGVHQSNHHNWAQLQECNEKLNASLGNAHHWYLRATAAEQRVNDLIVSTSWRITAPLRKISIFLKEIAKFPKRLAKYFLRKILFVSNKLLSPYPNLRRSIVGLLKRYPKVYRRLHDFSISYGILKAPYFSKEDSALGPCADMVDAVFKTDEYDNAHQADERNGKYLTLRKKRYFDGKSVVVNYISPLEKFVKSSGK